MVYYAGSTMFLWLSDWTRLPIDQCNFLITQFLCLGAAFAYRRFLHPTKVSPETRLVVALFLGLFFTYFCFGIDILHLIGLPLCCFLAIQFLPVGISHCVCLGMSLVYLSAVHLWRQWTDYGAYVIDITGPLMIITQKVTSLAFSLHDGLGKSWDVLTPSQRRYAIRRKPGVLEYFGYVLNFQGVCAGPMVFYVDYEEFIRGTNFQHTANARGLSIPPKKTPLKLENGVNSEASRCSSSVELTSGPVAATSPPCDSPLDFDVEASPVVEVTAKVSHSLLFALAFLIFAPLFDIRRLKDDDFLNSNFIYRAFYIVAATSVARWKYYLAWILADAIANASGLGFGGYDTYGSPHWDLLSNVDVRGVEIGPSFRELIDSWNKGTSRWLRMTIYERVPKFRTLSAYLVSAFWHGFYPGYYLTFIGGALFTLASRAARRSIRPLFLKSPRTKFIYDCITTVAARFMLAYITYPFVLLDWKPSMDVYKSFYFIPHIIGLLYIIALPIILPAPKRERVPAPKKTEVNEEEKLKSS